MRHGGEELALGPVCAHGLPPRPGFAAPEQEDIACVGQHHQKCEQRTHDKHVEHTRHAVIEQFEIGIHGLANLLDTLHHRAQRILFRSLESDLGRDNLTRRCVTTHQFNDATGLCKQVLVSLSNVMYGKTFREMALGRQRDQRILGMPESGIALLDETHFVRRRIFIARRSITHRRQGIDDHFGCGRDDTEYPGTHLTQMHHQRYGLIPDVPGCALPLDHGVVAHRHQSEQDRERHRGGDNNFLLHVIRESIDLPPDTSCRRTVRTIVLTNNDAGAKALRAP